MSEQISARSFIQIKTDRLNYEHFLYGPRTFIIAKWGKRKEQGADKLCLVMDGEESTPFMPCQGMIKCLISEDGWGDDLNSWIGKSITLFGDSSVKFGKQEIGGVRISHISGISKPYETKISERRGVRIDYEIKQLPQYPVEDFDKNVDAWLSAINAGKLKISALVNKISAKGALTNEQYMILKGGK